MSRKGASQAVHERKISSVTAALRLCGSDDRIAGTEVIKSAYRRYRYLHLQLLVGCA